MVKYQLLVFGLLALGVFLLFQFSMARTWAYAKGAIPEVKPKRLTLRKLKEELCGLTKLSFRRRLLLDVGSVLSFEGRGGDLPRMKSTCLMLALAGAAVGLLTGNLFLSPVLALLCYFVPLWIIKSRSGHYQAQTAIELESALAIITSSYLRSENLVGAVEENLNYLHEPVKTPFRIFLTQTEMISADVVSALRDLQQSFPNDIFQDWCDIMIRCQDNTIMKAVFKPTLQSFADIREIQSEYDVQMSMHRKDNLTLCIGVIVALFLFCLLGGNWFSVLYTSVIGKIICAVILLIAFLDINKVVELTEPLSFSSLKKGVKK